LTPSITTIVMAGGLGTRMRSAVPKVLHELCGRPMLEWVVAAAREAGSERVVAVVSPAIAEAVHARLPDVALAEQSPPLGTGHAAEVGLAALPGDIDTVLVLYGDTPAIHPETIHRVIAARSESGAAAALVSARIDTSNPYGRIVRGPHGVERIVEVRDASPEELAIEEANVGIYCFDAAALRSAVTRLDSRNAQGERYLTDVVAILAADGRTTVAVDEPDHESCDGVNTMVELARLESRINRRLCERHMLNGARIVDPATTYLDSSVELVADCRIEPFTTLRAGTIVARGAVVGPHVVAIGAEIGEDVVVGPFAYLRPGTVLHHESRVGRFVELKNTRLGPRSKVPHLSYVGDAEIGEDSNIGAGNITANYDGERKNRTVIGNRVHTSSDTVFVAPVTVGDDAYTGAGSTITDDIPPGALGIARPRQTNIEGYADRVTRRRTS
jgi:bifunctional UDP-N-acetylglucosamine pyrophosphorylase / glucosamine-1-phosphate N-acetyltransferase